MDPWIKQLSPALVVKARVELNEIQDEVPNQIQTLRETIEKDSQLNFRTDNSFLLRFLRARKFDQEKSLELMKSYYKQRQNYPQLFAKLSTTGIAEALSSNYHGVLFDRDSQGRPILIFNSLDHWDPAKFSLEDITANFLLSLELLIEEDEVQINGIVALIDVKGLNIHQIPYVTPSALKQFFTLTLNAFPVRFKEIHYINEPVIFDAVYLLFKPFLSQKMRDRVIFHGSNCLTLHDRIQPGILPVGFGGMAGPYDNTRWNAALADHDEQLKQDLVYGFVDAPK